VRRLAPGTVEESLDGSNSTVETPEKTYDHEEFIETAVETGLQTLIKMRRDGETYPDEGITLP
ncbi:MAG: hypothetical protein SVU32_03370, partial [Candidatus Nanohaloarchaea archaeon]|nr:hypothetical protein [Candidatus Nanohaloarchaea archaeon]